MCLQGDDATVSSSEVLHQRRQIETLTVHRRQYDQLLYSSRLRDNNGALENPLVDSRGLKIPQIPRCVLHSLLDSRAVRVRSIPNNFLHRPMLLLQLRNYLVEQQHQIRSVRRHSYGIPIPSLSIRWLPIPWFYPSEVATTRIRSKG
jgi:hypothetical protein